MELIRSHTTAIGKPHGWAAIEVVDDKGARTPVRMGIYDAQGRIMLPNDEAVALRNGVMDVTRIVERGGMSGFAHGISPERDCPADITMSNVERGMVLYVPTGNVRFVEVMSVNCMGTSLWFDFLNLGYKLTPAAGTDYPAGAVPGAVRAYAKLEGAFSPAAWYIAFGAGNAFVTSGPTIEFTINGKPMGSALRVKRGAAPNIAAKASLNPDYGPLASIDVIEQGTVVKRVAGGDDVSALDLTDTRTAEQGTWFVLQARGRDKSVIAWSAPVYVSVGGDRTWKREAVPAIVAKLKARMQGVLVPEAPQSFAVEPYDAAAAMAKYWAGQQPALKQRVEAATVQYDALAKAAAAGK